MFVSRSTVSEFLMVLQHIHNSGALPSFGVTQHTSSGKVSFGLWERHIELRLCDDGNANDPVQV